jgi:hypothetical protein
MAPDNVGTVVITLVVTDSKSVTTPETFALTVNPYPVITVSDWSATVGFPSDPLPFTLSLGTGALTLLWDSQNTAILANTDVLVANNALTMTPLTTGTVTVAVTVRD